MQFPTKQDNVATMSSLELVEIINSLRTVGRAELRHDNLMRRIENHPGIDSPRWRGEYKDSTGRTLKCYHLPKRECELLVMSESLEVQTKVYDRMMELDRQLSGNPSNQFAPDLIQQSKTFRALYGVARMIGLDKNVSAISANNAVYQTSGVNMLQLLGQTHLDNPEQTLYYTPTELGLQIDVSARSFNLLLAEAGMQSKVGEKWVPSDAAAGLYRVLDTGKKHGDGTMVQQIKWSDKVLARLKPLAA